MIHSKKYTLHLFDWIKGGIVGAGTAAINAVVTTISPDTILSSGGWKSYLAIGATAFVVYILKNLFTNSEGKLASEPKAEIK